MSFTIADINALDQDGLDDQTYADEPVEEAEESSKKEEEEDSEEDGFEQNQPGFPARVNITIEKVTIPHPD